VKAVAISKQAKKMKL